jgi:hypothetical protein
VFVPGEHFDPVYSLWVRPVVYLRVEHLSGSFKLVNSGLDGKPWERADRDKHSSLIQTFINYRHKKFYSKHFHFYDMAIITVVKIFIAPVTGTN